MRLLTMLVVASVVSIASCSAEQGILERGGPRIPDVVGVVTDATLQRIELDHGRVYDIADSVESFLTRSHRVASLLSWEGKYVHIGLDDGKVSWIAGIGVVVKDKSPRVFYSGVVERLERARSRAFFEDGTVLNLARNVDLPAKGTEVLCEIDVRRGVVTNVR